MPWSKKLSEELVNLEYFNYNNNFINISQHTQDPEEESPKFKLLSWTIKPESWSETSSALSERKTSSSS